jgi:hypothetical protein
VVTKLEGDFKLFNLISTIFVLDYLILTFSISPTTYSELGNDTSIIKSDAETDSNFIVKLSSRGGFAWQYHSIIYNSTINHLIFNDQNYDAIIGNPLSQTLTDSELNGKQKQTLWNIIREGNILNLSFKNEKEGCCDLVYYDLIIISGNKINSLQWNSRNYDSNSTYYKTIPPVVIDLVNTLMDYAKNSTVIYSQSELPR